MIYSERRFFSSSAEARAFNAVRATVLGQRVGHRDCVRPTFFKEWIRELGQETELKRFYKMLDDRYNQPFQLEIQRRSNEKGLPYYRPF
jgi:hypothetical protein